MSWRSPETEHAGARAERAALTMTERGWGGVEWGTGNDESGNAEVESEKEARSATGGGAA